MNITLPLLNNIALCLHTCTAPSAFNSIAFPLFTITYAFAFINISFSLFITIDLPLLTSITRYLSISVPALSTDLHSSISPGHPSPCQKCSKWPLAEMSWRGSLLKRSLDPPDDPIDQRTELSWTKHLLTSTTLLLKWWHIKNQQIYNTMNTIWDSKRWAR